MKKRRGSVRNFGALSRKRRMKVHTAAPVASGRYRSSYGRRPGMINYPARNVLRGVGYA